MTSTLATSFLIGCGAQPQQQQASLPNPPSSASSPSTGSASSPAAGTPGSGSINTGLPSSSGRPTGAAPGTGSSGASAGVAGTQSPAGGRSGPQQRGTEPGNQPGNPRPGSNRTATTAPAAGQQPSAQPPGLEQGSQQRLEDFSQQAPGGASATSAAERVGELDSALNSSISSYDGMILRERENMANRANAKGSEDALEQEDVSGPLFDEIGSTPAPAEEDGPGEAYETAAGSGTAEGPGGPVAGRGNVGAAPPADIPSGNDDDIVARQIREAALNEPDPELRAKLWEEYRKYKSQK